MPARVVGRWVARKEHYVGRYVSIFANGMRRQWDRRCYVELFAGPGLSFDKSLNEFTDGSPIRALKADLTDFVFVDSDPGATRALAKRTAIWQKDRPVHIVTGDCNRVVDEITATMPAVALTLAFVDPTNWQVEMTTVRSLAAERRIDLLLTFHAGQMKRVERYDVPALDAFFGSDIWRAALRLPRGERSARLLSMYNEALTSLGYRPDCYRSAVPVRNSRNVIMYYLVLFTKHERGLDFWRKAIAIDENRQPLLLFD